VITRRVFVRGVGTVGAALASGTSVRSEAAEAPPETTTLRLIQVPSLCRSSQRLALPELAPEGTERMTSLARLADEAFDLYEPPGDRIDREEQALERDGAEQRRSSRRDEAGRRDFTIVDRDADLANGPDLPASSGRLDGLVTLRRQLELIGHRTRDDEQRRAGVDEHVDRHDAARRASESRRDVEEPHGVDCMVAITSCNCLRIDTEGARRWCALQPDKVARFLVDKSDVERNDYAVQSLKDVVYGKWREHDPADAVRFYALRLYEAGVIKSSPQKILAQGADWRFVNELKKEMKS